METMQITIQKNGSLLIPQSLLKASGFAGFKAGSTVNVDAKADGLHVSSPHLALAYLRKTMGKKLMSSKQFIAERRREAKREMKKFSRGN